MFSPLVNNTRKYPKSIKTSNNLPQAITSNNPVSFATSLFIYFRNHDYLKKQALHSFIVSVSYGRYSGIPQTEYKVRVYFLVLK